MVNATVFMSRMQCNKPYKGENSFALNKSRATDGKRRSEVVTAGGNPV
jgi:hypothetical protein